VQEEAIVPYGQTRQPQWVPAVQYPTAQQQDSWTLKEKLIYSLIGLVAVGGVIFIAKKIIRDRVSNKEENKSFEDGTPATYAKQIKMTFENDGWPGTDTNALRTILTEIPSQDEFEKVKKSYARLYSKARKKANLLDDMSSELQTTEYNEMMQIMDAKPKKKEAVAASVSYKAWAKRMKAAFDKTYGFLPGTDGDAIVAVFNEIPNQAAFVQVADAYKQLYGTNMLDDLKSESEFGQYDNWMKIITSKPQN
jgi:hypothetical protein